MAPLSYDIKEYDRKYLYVKILDKKRL